MRKTKILFMLTMCCLSLAACGQGVTNTSSTTEVTPSTNPSSEAATSQTTTPFTNTVASSVIPSAERTSRCPWCGWRTSHAICVN